MELERIFAKLPELLKGTLEVGRLGNPPKQTRWIALPHMSPPSPS
jgi:hypothetical protein